MKIFVTGGKGFVAQHLIPRLESLRNTVVADWRYWHDRYDLIIHLAAITHIKTEFDPKLIESNFILTNEVFKRSEKIIFASSCSARHNTNPYATSKIWAEYLGQKHGNATGLRFFNIFGRGNNKGIVKFLMDKPDGSRISIRGPELIRDYIHVSDIVNFIVKSDTLPCGVHDVGTGAGTRTIDLVNLFMEISGKKFHLDFLPPGGNEPLSMISDNIVPAMSLRQGLEKTIMNA